MQWWLGDWWAYGEHAYGERANAVKSDDWEGPAFGTCMNAATVCRKFEASRRREVLSFNIHVEAAALPIEWQDKILDWATSGDDGRPRTIRAIRDEVKQKRAFLSQGWTPDQLDRKAAAEAGECVVANMRNDTSGDRKIDEALINWAEAEGRFVRVDRKTEWGNPFEMPGDGDRATVCASFAKFYLPNKPSLLCDIATLPGQVLGCWCHPEECHAHIIAEVANRVTKGEGTPEEIADLLADIDG